MLRICLIIATLFAATFTAFAQSSAKIDAAALYERSLPSIVLAICGKANGDIEQGTGVILRSDGIVATNFHVCGDATSAKLKLRNGDIYDDVSLIDSDERRDIAILKIKAVNLPALPTADSDSTRVGSTIYVIGAPQGLEGTISSGIVSSIRPASEMFPGEAEGFRVIQFTAPIAKGSSGSPLLDEKGQAIGMVFALRMSGQNLNAAIPINYVTPLLGSKSEGKQLAKLSLESPARPKANGTVEDIAGTYTGGWASNDNRVSGALVMNVSFSNGLPFVRAVLTGSEYLNQLELDVTVTPMGAGIWKMDYKGKKPSIRGTGLFKGGRFVGDYKFKKFIWVDNGQWTLEKTL